LHWLIAYRLLLIAAAVKPETRNFFIYQLPAILWTALVLSASSDTFSGAQTGQILQALLGFLFAEVPHGLLVAAHLIIRKLAHLTEYGILAWLLYRARGDTQRVWDLRWARLALAGVLTVAGIDEFHQRFVASRVGSPVDVAIDLLGGFLALLIVRRLASRSGAATPAVANQ
jgi:VanZ family protein